MKKTYKPYKAAAVIAAAVIMTSGCGQKQQEGSTMQTEEETSASGTETSSAVQRPNPMTKDRIFRRKKSLARRIFGQGSLFTGFYAYQL